MVQEPEARPALNMRHYGETGAPVLALHCGLGTSGMWKGVAQHLAGRRAVTAPDLPGHGRSAPFGPSDDVHDQACDALRGMITPGIHLMGHSFGATVALRLALETPAKVSSLTLIEPVFFAAARGRTGFDEHGAREETFFEAYKTGDMREAARVFNRIWGGGIKWDSFPKTAQEGMARGMPFVAGTEPSLWQDCHGLLKAGLLEALHCPVTLIRGAQSVPIIEQVHAGLLDRLPNAAEVVVEGAGHMLTVTHPEAIAQAILANEQALQS